MAGEVVASVLLMCVVQSSFGWLFVCSCFTALSVLVISIVISTINKDDALFLSFFFLLLTTIKQ